MNLTDNEIDNIKYILDNIFISHINFNVSDPKKSNIIKNFNTIKNKEIIKNQNFNLEMYKKYNDDLKKLNDNELKEHYNKIGKNELRICGLHNSMFNPEDYKNLNPDLINLNNLELWIHFVKHGIYENRFCYYDNNFNPIYYIKNRLELLSNLNLTKYTIYHLSLIYQ